MKKLITIFLPLILGGIVGFLTNIDIYSEYTNPPLSPPGIVFPIVWSVLYLLMGISYEISSKNKEIKFFYYLQLIFNYLWTFIFFTFKLKFLAIIWIIILVILVIYMIKAFYKDNKLSAYLQIPYLIWLLFATYLTIGIYILN